ncbi:MAG TPA: META and DUF4377 domain-containing protein, partial [Polyangiaceae bacterium]|nr:META and DUF4377 domain-containing protein [Polyangiaceae bacterium]
SPPKEPTASEPSAVAREEQRVEDYEWSLVAAVDGQGKATTAWVVPNQPALSLHFEDQRVTVGNLCNIVSADYSVEGNRLKIGHPVSTKKACDDEALMDLEQRVGQQLPTAQGIELRGGEPPRLTIRWTDGSQWELSGSPTAQKRFGSAPERVFFEVAAEPVPCAQAAQPSCMNVREIRYDDNGIKQSEGPWQTFSGNIEGFSFKPGVRNVLRLHRFTLPNSPANTPAYAYVLDMVVETEMVP